MLKDGTLTGSMDSTSRKSSVRQKRKPQKYEEVDEKKKRKKKRRSPGRLSFPGSSINQIEQTIQELRTTLADMTAELQHLREEQEQEDILEESESTSLKKKPLVRMRPLTYEEKQQLSEEINNLSPEHMQVVVEIVQESEPDFDKTTSDGEIELDFSQLSDHTLRELRAFCLRRKSRQRQAEQRRAKRAHLRAQQESEDHHDEHEDGPDNLQLEVTRERPLLELKDSLATLDSSSEDFLLSDPSISIA